MRQVESSELERKCKQLEEDLDGLQQQLSRLQNEVHLLEQVKEDQRKLMEDAEERVQKADLRRREALDTLAGAEKVGQERAVLIKEKDEEIKALKMEIVNGKTDAEAASEKLVSLENQLSQLARIRDDLVHEVDNAQRNAADITREAEVARAEILDITNLRAKALEEGDALKKQLQSAEETISGLQERVAELGAELTEQRAVAPSSEADDHQEKLLEQIKDLTHELEVMKSTVSAKEDRLQEMEETIRARDGLIQQAEEEYREAVTSAEQLRASLAERETSLSQMQRQLDSAQEDHERMLAEREEIEAQVSKLSHQLEQANNKLRESEESLKFEQEQCALAVEEVR